MRRQTFLSSLLLVVMLLLGGCGGNAAAPAAPAPTVEAAPTADANAYWDLVQQGQEAYDDARFEDAADLARQAASINPADNTSWELLSQAAIAQAGDEYLSTLPGHRFRLPVEALLRDQVNQSTDWFLIDVREPDEFAAGHIEGAVNFPLNEFMQHLDELPSSKTAPILLYCHTQKRATHALVIMHELGYIKTYNLEGGYAAYQEWMDSKPLPTPGPTPTPGPEEPDYSC